MLDKEFSKLFQGKKPKGFFTNTLTLDKPVNLENNDIVRVIADPNPDSSSVDVEAYASILELT